MKLDIAIVGAGISGLYAGLKLAQHQFASANNTIIFEANNSVGGRLKTLYTGTALPINLGAHRINTHTHVHMQYLLQELQIPCEAIHYELCQHFYSSKEKNAWEQMQYVKNILSKHYKYCDNPYKVSFHQLFCGKLNHQHLQLLKNYSGYDVLDHPKISFAEAMRILDDHPESESLKLDVWQQTTLGVQSIVTRLCQLLHVKRVPIHLQHKLIDISVATNGYSLIFETRQGLQQVHAKKLILALAKPDLEALPFLKSKFSPLLEAIETVPLFKGFLYYQQPFWSKSSPFYIISANPLRKIYFCYDRSEISFYADSAHATHWHQLTDDPDAALALICRNLAKLLRRPVNKVPKPTEFIYKFWQNGVSFWKTAYNPKKLNQACIHNDSGIHIIGDMFSPQGGWMEGALDNVMQLIQFFNSWRKAS